MTKKIALAVAATLALASAPAMADGWNFNSPYASVKGGWNNFLDDGYNAAGAGHSTNFDNGYDVNAAFGIRYNPQIRAELEIGYKNADANSGEVEMWTGLANVYYDYNIGEWTKIITPYVGFGIGAASVSLDGLDGGLTGTDTTFIYQATAGAAYNFTPKLAATLEYRYLGSTKAEAADAEVEVDSHNILAGIRYNF